MIGTLAPSLQLFGIKSERLELPAPLGRQVAEPFDPNAAGQATFNCRFDQVGGQEGERDGHVNMPNAAPLTGAKLFDARYPT